MQSETIEKHPKEQKEQSTTIKIPPSIKGQLDELKTEPEEPYAGVIYRLIEEKTPSKSTEDIVYLTLPRKVYRMALMVLPNNLSDQIQKGVR